MYTFLQGWVSLVWLHHLGCHHDLQGLTLVAIVAVTDKYPLRDGAISDGLHLKLNSADVLVATVFFFHCLWGLHDCEVDVCFSMTSTYSCSQGVGDGDVYPVRVVVLEYAYMSLWGK